MYLSLFSDGKGQVCDPQLCCCLCSSRQHRACVWQNRIHVYASNVRGRSSRRVTRSCTPTCQESEVVFCMLLQSNQSSVELVFVRHRLRRQRWALCTRQCRVGPFFPSFTNNRLLGQHRPERPPPERPTCLHLHHAAVKHILAVRPTSALGRRHNEESERTPEPVQEYGATISTASSTTPSLTNNSQAATPTPSSPPTTHPSTRPKQMPRAASVFSAKLPPTPTATRRSSTSRS